MTDTATSPVAGPLEPLTQERLEAQLSGLNLQHFRNEEGLTVTAFPGMACFFEFAEIGCKITTRWLGLIESEEDTATVRLRTNELNRFMPLVRTHPITRSDNSTIVLLEAPLFAPHGVTDGQLKAMLQFYFSTIHDLQRDLRKTLPHIADEMPPTGGSETTDADTTGTTEA